MIIIFNLILLYSTLNNEGELYMITEQTLDSIFKAYDVRGIVGTELTEEVAERIGRAMATWLPDEGTVAIGRDMRPDSLKLAEALIKGLTEQGRDVWDIGEVTSDMIYFTTGHYNLAGGMMVTASHNPGDFNGIKFCGKNAKAIGIESGLLEIKELVKKNGWTTDKKPGTAIQKDVIEGIIVMRKGENPAEVLDRVRDKVKDLNDNILPKDVYVYFKFKKIIIKSDSKLSISNAKEI